jgi:hypothetical protein
MSFIATLQFLPLTLHANETNADVIGSWKIVKVLDSSEIAPFSDRQAQGLIGKVLEISGDKLEFAGRVCKKPDFERTQEEPVRYFRESAHASSAKLGLPDPVTVVHISCTYVYPKSANEMVIHWKGFFFDALRQGK